MAGGFGIAVWRATLVIPPGSGFGSPGARTAAVLAAPSFFVHVVLAAGLLAAAGVAIARLIAAGEGPAAAAAANGSHASGEGDQAVQRNAPTALQVAGALAPIAWGAALPSLSLLLDAWFFWPAAPPLAFLGLTLGVAWALHRCRSLGIDAGPFPASAGRAVVVGLAVAVPAALLLAGWSAPSGDEPHYLITAHSIVFDGDLDLADEYRERVYAPFHPVALSPHYRPGARPGSRYSMHGIGLPLLIAPAYALGRAIDGEGGLAMVLLPRLLLVLLYGVFAAVLYGFIIDAVGDERAAAAGTAATTLLAPLLFAPLFLFAELPAMLLSLIAFRGLVARRRGGVAHGLALASLPFVGIKYLPLAVAILVVGVWRTPPTSRWRTAARAGAPLAAALLLHGLYTWVLYGSLSPASIYLGAGEQAGAPALGGDWNAYLSAWPAALATAVGYLLDQKEGLLAYGPHYLLVVAGCGALARRAPGLVPAGALAAAAYVAPYALSQQLGGQGPPVRPLMAILWLAAPALGIALVRVTARPAYDGLRGGLLGLAVSLTVAYAAQPELLPHDYPVLASRLLQQYTPHGSGWWLWFPQWVNVDVPNPAVTALWTVAIVAVGALAWGLGRPRPASTQPLETGRARQGGAPQRGVEEFGAVGARGIAPAAGRTVSAAVAVMVAAAALVLVHHAAVVRTDRHRPTALPGGVVAWIPERLPPVAFAEAAGVWATPGGPVDFLVTVPAPPAVVGASLRTLVRTEVGVALQGAEAAATVAPDARYTARLRPAPGRRDGAGHAYHVRLWAARGAAPADLEGGADERHLGVFLRLETPGPR